jgi:hypothetical protein
MHGAASLQFSACPVRTRYNRFCLRAQTRFWLAEFEIGLLLQQRFHGLRVGTERLEFPTSTVKPLRPGQLIATLLQHLTNLNKKSPPQFQGRLLKVLATAVIFGHFCLISSKILCFLWS